ncbi:MAG: aldo/keto reductase [Cyanobacteria bacterium]|nr:aldo/keto reductase [Cyanobacteriota bacterium]
MISRDFGLTGKKVPIIGQGSWQMPEIGKKRAAAIEALRRGIEIGATHIDTAELYGDAELVIGDAIKDIDRDSLYIVSKVLPSNAAYTKTIDACEKSLRRLKLEYLDCYLLHWRGPTPLAETLAAFEKLEKDGKIKSFGVSNFDVDDLEEAISCLTVGKIACNQVLYNLDHRAIERQLIPFCAKNSISVVGYTPFGSIPSTKSEEHESLKTVAKKHDATIRQVILAFLTRLPNTFAIPKASKLAHQQENAGAGDLVLDEADIELLDRQFPVPDRDVPLAML